MHPQSQCRSKSNSSASCGTAEPQSKHMKRHRRSRRISSSSSPSEPITVTASALGVFHNVVDYYTQNGSTVSVAASDMSKAFDKVNHFGL